MQSSSLKTLVKATNFSIPYAEDKCLERCWTHGHNDNASNTGLVFFTVFYVVYNIVVAVLFSREMNAGKA